MISAVRKLFGRFLPLLRLLNALSEREVALYRAIEHDLIRPTAVQDRSSRHPWLPLPPAPVVRQALAGEADYRLIDPAQMSAEDSEFVQQHGLDMALLLANSDSLQQGQGSGDDQQDSKSDPTEFQRDALMQGAIQAICPITGQLLKSDRGFIAEQNQPIFYLFRGQFPFLLAVGREGRGYIKL